MYYIYWIKDKNHTNILKEGYVGISNNPERRFLEHVNGSSIVSNAIKKYNDNIEIVILYEFANKEDALLKENELRPIPRIGWNIAAGGQMPPEIKYMDDVKDKISKTMKSKGTIPYCEKTHSPESMLKNKETRERKKYQWFYNIETLECKMFSAADDDIPHTWVRGRKPRKNIKKRIDMKCGIDYGNMRSWAIYKNDIFLADVINLKKWCRDHDLPYFAVSKHKNEAKIIITEKVLVSLSDNKTIIENEYDTNLISKDYAHKIQKSQSYICNALKKGYYLKKRYDIYKFINI